MKTIIKETPAGWLVVKTGEVYPTAYKAFVAVDRAGRAEYRRTGNDRLDISWKPTTGEGFLAARRVVDRH